MLLCNLYMHLRNRSDIWMYPLHYWNYRMARMRYFHYPIRYSRCRGTLRMVLLPYRICNLRWISVLRMDRLYNSSNPLLYSEYIGTLRVAFMRRCHRHYWNYRMCRMDRLYNLPHRRHVWMVLFPHRNCTLLDNCGYWMFIMPHSIR